MYASQAYIPPMTSHANTTAVQARRERVVARVNAEQKRLFQRAASLQGRTLSDFLVTAPRRPRSERSATKR